MDVRPEPCALELAAQNLRTFRQLIVNCEREIAESKVQQLFVCQAGPVGRKRRAHLSMKVP